MLKKTETEETVVFFVTFLSLVAFQLGGGAGPQIPPSGYAYALESLSPCMLNFGNLNPITCFYQDNDIKI